jgi:hypothetical protein
MFAEFEAIFLKMDISSRLQVKLLNCEGVFRPSELTEEHVCAPAGNSRNSILSIDQWHHYIGIAAPAFRLSLLFFFFFLQGLVQH